MNVRSIVYCSAPVYAISLPVNYIHLLVVLDIDDSRLPLASRDMALEQDVDLAVRAALHLRQEEVCHNETEETGSSPDVTALSTEVGLLRFVSNCLL
jgi:hypothetical protein